MNCTITDSYNIVEHRHLVSEIYFIEQKVSWHSLCWKHTTSSLNSKICIVSSNRIWKTLFMIALVPSNKLFANTLHIIFFSQIKAFWRRSSRTIVGFHEFLSSCQLSWQRQEEGVYQGFCLLLGTLKSMI